MQGVIVGAKAGSRLMRALLPSSIGSSIKTLGTAQPTAVAHRNARSVETSTATPPITGC
jgi:hypothetical protein